MPTSPVYCSHFTLGNPKKSFSTVLFIGPTYFKLFTLLPLTHHTWKMSPHYFTKCTTFSFDWKYVAFLQTLVALKKAGCGLALLALKITGCDMWQMECQARNITANVQSDRLLHGYMLPVFFATHQLYRIPRSVEIQPMSQQDASATRPYRGLVFDTRENKSSS